MNIPEKIADQLNARDKALEQAVITSIATSRRIPTDMHSDLFYGRESELFTALHSQWVKSGQIDPIALKDDLRTVLKEALDNPGTMSKAALEELNRYRVIRMRTAAIIRALQDPDPIAGTGNLQSALSMLILAHSDSNYDHQVEIERMVTALEGLAKSVHGTVAGYSSGIPILDQKTNGFEKGKFYAIGGLKKTGKSRFCVQIAIAAARSGARVIWNSLEMSAFDLNLLALARFSGMNSSRLSRAMSREELNGFTEHMGELSELDWKIYRDYTISEMRARIAYEKMMGNVDMVIVDFVQRMKAPEYRGNRAQEVESISKGLADIGRELNVSVIALSQLSGAAEHIEGDDMPDMRHMKESQGIAENADCIITMHDPERHKSPYTKDGAYVCPTIKLKIEQRYGVSGEIISLDADMRCCRFVQQTIGADRDQPEAW